MDDFLSVALRVVALFGAAAVPAGAFWQFTKDWRKTRNDNRERARQIPDVLQGRMLAVNDTLVHQFDVQVDRYDRLTQEYVTLEERFRDLKKKYALLDDKADELEEINERLLDTCRVVTEKFERAQARLMESGLPPIS